MNTYQPLHQNITKLLHAKYFFAYNNMYISKATRFTTRCLTPECKLVMKFVGFVSSVVLDHHMYNVMGEVGYTLMTLYS